MANSERNIEGKKYIFFSLQTIAEIITIKANVANAWLVMSYCPDEYLHDNIFTVYTYASHS